MRNSVLAAGTVVVVRPDARLTFDDDSASDVEIDLPAPVRPRNVGARAVKRIRG